MSRSNERLHFSHSLYFSVNPHRLWNDLARYNKILLMWTAIFAKSNPIQFTKNIWDITKFLLLTLWKKKKIPKTKIYDIYACGMCLKSLLSRIAKALYLLFALAVWPSCVFSISRVLENFIYCQWGWDSSVSLCLERVEPNQWNDTKFVFLKDVCSFINNH